MEVKNVGDVDVDLAGVTVSDRADDATRREPLGGVLAPGARAVVDVTAFGLACEETVFLLQGDAVVDRTTLVVARADATWSRLPEPIAAASAFSESFPTRGLENQAFAVGDVRLNELDCRGVERVEIVNAGAAAVDLAGYSLTSDDDATTRLVFPAIPLPAGGRLVLTEGEDFTFTMRCDGGVVGLRDGDGVLVDTAVLADIPQDFTWSRLPDGVGAFAAGEESIGAENSPPVETGVGLFDVTAPTTITLAIAEADRPALAAPGDGASVQAILTVAGDTAIDATVSVPRGGTFLVAFADGARFRGLEHLLLDVRNHDESLTLDIIASALFRARGVLAPRVGLARLDIPGFASQPGRVVEVVDERLLRRTFPSTGHLYDAGDGPADLTAADRTGLTVVVGEPGDVGDLDGLVNTLAPFITGPGLIDGASDVFRMGATIRFLATDAWLGHDDGYGRARGDVFVHIDDGLEARLLPGDLDGMSLGGDVVPVGSALHAACANDPPCAALLEEELTLTSAAVIDADLDGLIDDVKVGLAGLPGTDANSAEAVREALRARADEVTAALGAP